MLKEHQNVLDKILGDPQGTREGGQALARSPSLPMVTGFFLRRSNCH